MTHNIRTYVYDEWRVTQCKQPKSKSESRTLHEKREDGRNKYFFGDHRERVHEPRDRFDIFVNLIKIHGFRSQRATAVYRVRVWVRSTKRRANGRRLLRSFYPIGVEFFSFKIYVTCRKLRFYFFLFKLPYGVSTILNAIKDQFFYFYA